MAEKEEVELTDAPGGPADPQSEGDPRRQHPMDQSFLLQITLDLKDSVSKFGERIDILKEKIDELRSDLHRDIDALRADRRSDAERVASDLRSKLDNRSFWIGAGVIAVGSGLVSNMPQILEFLRKTIQAVASGS